MSIHDLNKDYETEKGATMLRGYDGFDNYFLLGTFPEFGARLALRARNMSAGKKGTIVGFKLRLMPEQGAEYGNWKLAIPSLEWKATNDERRSACFGVGLAAWTREEVNLAVKDVDYPALLDNWLTALGLTWDAKQRELLPAYLADAENALFADDFGDGVAPVDVDSRIAHAARSIVPEETLYEEADYSGASENDDALDDLGGDDDPDPDFD